MVILLDCCHPADVHFFRAVACCLEEQGRTVRFTARPKDVVLPLLEGFGIDHTVVGTHHPGRLSKALGLASRSLALARMAKRHKAEVLVGFCNPYVAQAARLLRKPSLVLTDTDTGHAQNRFLHPATLLLTPEWFGPLQRPHRLHLAGPWFKELAYLRDFVPDEKFSKDLEQPNIIVRTVGWTAAHDHGYGRQFDPDELVESLGSKHAMYQSHEGAHPGIEGSKIMELPLPAHQIHHALGQASLVITEGATMAAEAALLGRPTIYLNPIQPAYLRKLVQAGLMSIATDPEHVLDLAHDYLQPSKEQGQRQVDGVRDLVGSCWPIEGYVADLLLALIGHGTVDVKAVHDSYVKAPGGTTAPPQVVD